MHNLKSLLSFTEWPPTKIQPAITPLSAGEFCRQPAHFASTLHLSTTLGLPLGFSSFFSKTGIMDALGDTCRQPGMIPNNVAEQGTNSNMSVNRMEPWLSAKNCMHRYKTRWGKWGNREQATEAALAPININFHNVYMCSSFKILLLYNCKLLCM